jgi:hypothetical protein
MRTVSPRVENGRIHATSRSLARGLCAGVVRDGLSSVRRFLSESWLIQLLGLALAGLLVLATSLCGLALVSTWVRTPYPPTAGLTQGGPEVGAGAPASEVTCCSAWRRRHGSDAGWPGR